MKELNAMIHRIFAVGTLCTLLADAAGRAAGAPLAPVQIKGLTVIQWQVAPAAPAR